MSSEPKNPWQPILPAERYRALDVLRGLALLGVLLINLNTSFRVSLAEYGIRFHTYPLWPDRTVDFLLAFVLEFKAFTLFSLCFGIGVAVQAERAAPRGVGFTLFLLRRFLVLLAMGLLHAFLIWNGDILTLYAVCGLLLLPLRRLPWIVLGILGVAAIIAYFAVPLDWLYPSDEFLDAHAERATQVYSQGSYLQIMVFRWQEALQVTGPFVLAVLPKTFGLMLLGVAAWRSGLARQPQRHQDQLWDIVMLAGSIGVAATLMEFYWTVTGNELAILWEVLQALSYIPLALAYAAAVFLWIGHYPTTRWATPFAAVGRMALTNYLTQSVVLGFIFYGYGLGLFGQVGPAVGALFGLALYAVQIVFSIVWLNWFQMGPVEWLWRCLSYGRLFPLRRPEMAKKSGAEKSEQD